MPVWSVTPDPANPGRLIAGLTADECAFQPRVYPVETGPAIVLAALKTAATDTSATQAGSCQFVVTLRAPLGRRVLLDAATGLPITRRQAPG